jgi:hypothetical protein
MTDPDRINEKFVWITPAYNGGVRICCGMQGEDDLTPDEAREAVRRIKEILGDD